MEKNCTASSEVGHGPARNGTCYSAPEFGHLHSRSPLAATTTVRRLDRILHSTVGSGARAHTGCLNVHPDQALHSSGATTCATLKPLVVMQTKVVRSTRTLLQLAVHTLTTESRLRDGQARDSATFGLLASPLTLYVDLDQLLANLWRG